MLKNDNLLSRLIPALFMCFPLLINAQSVSGTVFGIGDELKTAIPGANIIWLGTIKGTSSASDGTFTLSTSGIRDKRLIVSYMGYKSDTIAVGKNGYYDIILQPAQQQLKAVEITARQSGSFISEIQTQKVQMIGSKELKRAACCNLSESFETGASVDVMYSDAITGAKQIQLLGLSGVYSQIITENVGLMRGLGGTFGLSYIPGSWMQSISVSKGASSVSNGFESITGIINVEYLKPAESEKLFINLYGNQHGRMEANVHSAVKFNDKFSTMVMAHADNQQYKFDANSDGFMDAPQLRTYNIVNRWDYEIPGKYDSRLFLKYLDENRTGGKMDFDKNNFDPSIEKINNLSETYGFNIRTKRFEGFWKNGIIFGHEKSIALIISGIYHDQDGFFGFNKYNGIQKTFQANLLYSMHIDHAEKHSLNAGLSFISDDYTESFFRRDFTYLYQTLGVSDVTEPKDTLFTISKIHDSLYNLDRTETVPGAWAEYTFNPSEKFTFIAGLRYDIHSVEGGFFTPRIHLRYKPTKTLTIRASAGTGSRSANILTENYSAVSSQRNLIITEKLQREEAWNYGLSATQNLRLFDREASLDLEFFRTDFISQVIADFDSLPTAVFFYNLDGKSYAQSAMVQFSFEPVKNLTMLTAFRMSDVKTTINHVLREKPMVNRYKAILTTGYTTLNGKWMFDVTVQLNGRSRIPDTKKMPAALQRAEYSPVYPQLMAQITRKFKLIELYIGGENLTNFTQKDPITEAFAPYHTHFDTSMVWGPVLGTTIYAGLRFTMKNKDLEPNNK